MISSGVILNGLATELNGSVFPGEASPFVSGEVFNTFVSNGTDLVKGVTIDRCSDLCSAAISHNLGWFWFYIVVLFVAICFGFYVLFKINSRIKKLRGLERRLLDQGVPVPKEPILDFKNFVEDSDE